MPEDVKELEEFSRKLQEQIMEQIRDRYSEVVIDHWKNPRNFRKIENPSGYAKVKGPCGDTMEMFIKLTEETISDCTYQTDGCGSSIVCGSMATELAKDKSLTQALVGVSAGEILEKLGGLPEADVHCAHLAAETMRRALDACFYRESHDSRNPGGGEKKGRRQNP
jgi:nitrogen fixation NifU-like protein